jgi:hypothetical protein
MLFSMLGVGGLAAVAQPLLSRRRPEVWRLGSEGGEPALVIRTPRAKRVLGAVACAGMLLGSALLITVGGVVPGVLGVVVFGALLVLMAATMRRSRHLSLTPARLVLTGPTEHVSLAWDALAEAFVYEMPAGRTTMTMIAIRATDPAAVVRRRARWYGRLNRSFTGFDITWGAYDLEAEPENVIDALEIYRTAPLRRAGLGTPAERERLLADLGLGARAPARAAGLRLERS